MRHSTGEIIKVEVVNTTRFGAFIKTVEYGEAGLIHISQIKDAFIKKVEDHLTKGEIIEAKVLEIDERNRYLMTLIGLSEEKGTNNKKKIIEEMTPKEKKEEKEKNFNKMLTEFLQESSEIQEQIKKNECRKLNVEYRAKKAD